MQLVETDLEKILFKTTNDEKTNDRFSDFLTKLDSTALDEEIIRLEKIIAPQINCTSCGNCCKSLMVNINETEANVVADFLQKNRTEFNKLFVEKSEGGKMLINTIPCHFLSNNVCTIYEVRFESCREFPALHLPNFQKRLFTVFMHYARCPIIFNVMEELKEVVGFE